MRKWVGIGLVAILCIGISHAEDRAGKCGGCGHHTSSSDRSKARHNMFHTYQEQINKGFYTDPVSGWSEADQFMGNVENAQIDGKLSATQVGKLEKEFQDKYEAHGNSSTFDGKSGAVGSDDIGGIP